VFESIVAFWRSRLPWRRLPFFVAIILAASVLNSCGKSSTPTTTTTTPSVAVSCTPVQVTLGKTSICTASVVGESSTLVNWSLSPSGTGMFTSGASNSTSATYTAPSAFPQNNMNVVTITAASVVASTVTGTATITVIKPTTISAVTCVDPLTGAPPSPLAVSSGNLLNCAATDSTGIPVPVNWTVTNLNNPAGNNGTISSQGTYTAPLVPPAGQVVTITATSQADSTNSIPVMVTVGFGNNVLSGPFAFSTSGRLPNNAFWARVGSFTAGKDGTLSGIEDTNQGGTPNTVVSQRTFTGSFSVGPDGRGTMQFCEDARTSCPQGMSATSYFRIVVISPQQAQIIEFSSPTTTSATTIAGGEMISQDPAVFNTTNGSPLSGIYSFNFAGVSTADAEETATGEFSANGHGAISAGSTVAPVAPGELDINDSVSLTQKSLNLSTYTYSSSGRGTLTLSYGSTSPPTLITFGFYMVSASQAKFIEIDVPASGTTPDSILVGDAYIQQTKPTCAWTVKIALSGATVLETLGSASGVVVADVGSFMASNGAVTGVSMDQNSGGTYTQPAGSASDNYTMDMDGCGRGKLSIGSHSYVFYIISPSNAVLQEITSGTVAHGLLLPSLPPQGGFVNATLTGSYALRLEGTDAAGTAGKREDFLGQLTSAGSGMGLAGDLDLNDFGATQTGCVPLSVNCVAITNGTYSPAPMGSLRATMALHISTAPSATTRNLVLYMVTPTLFYVLDTDASGTAIGAIYNQF
jgi:hypothetical protein